MIEIRGSTKIKAVQCKSEESHLVIGDWGTCNVQKMISEQALKSVAGIDFQWNKKLEG